MNELFTKSITGRKKRKDAFEQKYDMNVVEILIRDLYASQKLTAKETKKILFDKYGYKLCTSKCSELIKKIGVSRTLSAAISYSKAELNYDIVILTDELRAIIDGIVIGDGQIRPNHNTKVARLSLGSAQKEFAEYCRNLMIQYSPNECTFREGEKGTGMWSFSTKHHPDLYKLYMNWYPNGKKDVPDDVVINKMSVLLWYLGDGSLSHANDSNSRTLKFSTNSFSREKIVNILQKKIELLGINITRVTSDNIMYVATDSIVKILNFMGGKSPVECYSYKFDIETWRTYTSMKELAAKVNLDYQKLANWVKTGVVRHNRSPGGKKVVFSPSDIEELIKRLDNGELSREKSVKAKTKFVQIIKDDFVFAKHLDETEDKYIERIVDFYQFKGFPYKVWTDYELTTTWHGLRKAQYIIPQNNVINWRNEGLTFADYFHPHIYDVNIKNKISSVDLFKNKDLFISALTRYKKLGGNITHLGVLSALTRNPTSKRVTNFSPLVARDLYNYYCVDGDKILDFSSGFSGRLIGASISSRKNLEYFGIDPNTKTYAGLVKTKQFVENLNDNFKSNIINDCAESFLPNYKDNMFDFCFTSPPYFDTEHYSDEKTQSYIKYPEYGKWLNGFLKPTLKEVFRVLKNGKTCVINIGNSSGDNLSDDCMNIMQDVGFCNFDNKHIAFLQYHFVKTNEKRLEPLIICQKPY